MKNRKNLSSLSVKVQKNGEAIVAAKNKVESKETAGYFFKEDDFKLFLDYVNDYENVADDKGIKVKEHDVHLGDGCFSTVTKGEFIIKNKYDINNRNNGPDPKQSYWKGEVAIKKMTTAVVAKDKFNPHIPVTTTLLTLKFMFGYLSMVENVHPEDFERYKEMPRVVRHSYGHKRSIVEDILKELQNAG